MKERYSIGETAALLGVTTQTLRHYDKMGLLKPRHIDSGTGYRYYAFDQFHYIDRIKYLQRFGLSLESIREIITTGSVDKLLPFLQQQKKSYQKELKKIMDTIENIDWYIDYFTFLNRNQHCDNLYKVWLERRYAICVPGYPEEYLHNMEVRLAAAKARSELKDLNYLRQYAYLIDFNKLMEKKFWATQYLIYLKEKPDFPTEYLCELPAGEYLCFRARILTNDWDVPPLAKFFKDTAVPQVVIANEFEENLKEYLGTQYEIQIHIPRNQK
ncbi:hypothetical protein SRRS_14120 [Sporomusa rhizae]|uniref:MerR family transcriptional regulator n=1 Tax=Sporomusa rhizae TaxID=357999 RepID=UPI00352BAAC6